MLVIIKVDALDFALGSVLLQITSDGKPQPIVIHSWKFEVAKLKNEIHDKELMDNVDFLNYGVTYTRGFPTIIVYNNHKERKKSTKETLEPRSDANC